MSTKRRPEFLSHCRWMMRHWMLDTLEAVHRMSWRQAAAAFLFSALLVSSACAEEVAAKKETVVKKESVKIKEMFNKILVSKEPKKEPLVQATSAGAKKKTEAVKKTVKKTGFPDMDEKDFLAEGHEKTVRGPIGGKSHQGIAVVYAVDELKGSSEMWVDMNSRVKFSGAKSFAKMEEGDIVELTYKELLDGSKRVPLMLRFVSNKPAEELVAEETSTSAAAATIAKPPSTTKVLKA